jgi:hypothetical protein
MRDRFAMLLGCAAAAFVALSVMLAFSTTHPVLASASIAVGLAVLASVAVILSQGRKPAPESLHRE